MTTTLISTTIAASATIAAVVGLIIFLTIREIADAGETAVPRLLSAHLLTYSVPLLVAFAIIVIVEFLHIID